MKMMFKSMLAISFTVILVSCSSNSNSNKDDGNTNPSDTVAAATPTSPEPTQAAPTLPLDVLTIYHTVKDYKLWRTAFDADSTRRNASGFRLIAVERAADKPENIKIVLMATDMTKAKAFGSDPALKEVMDKAGVISKPELNYWKIIRFTPANQKPNGSRLEVVHKVKDFDIWLKGFDAEGPATRAANGINDLALGRGIDDPNMVHIVFEVTDISKAKARLLDPALKKIMKDAGVEGAPTITFYNDSSK